MLPLCMQCWRQNWIRGLISTGLQNGLPHPEFFQQTRTLYDATELDVLSEDFLSNASAMQQHISKLRFLLITSTVIWRSENASKECFKEVELKQLPNTENERSSSQENALMNSWIPAPPSWSSLN